MIKGTQIDLRLINQGDVELLRRWRNQYTDDFFTKDHITPQQQKLWYERYSEDYLDRMFIVQLKDSTPVGTIALYNINISDRTAVLGRTLLIDGYRGKGYMAEAIQLLVNYSFTVVRLWRLRLNVYLDNAGAISLYHKCGFEASNRPIMLMEATNHDRDAEKPIQIDDFGEDD